MKGKGVKIDEQNTGWSVLLLLSFTEQIKLICCDRDEQRVISQPKTFDYVSLSSDSPLIINVRGQICFGPALQIQRNCQSHLSLIDNNREVKEKRVKMSFKSSTALLGESGGVATKVQLAQQQNIGTPKRPCVTKPFLFLTVLGNFVSHFVAVMRMNLLLDAPYVSAVSDMQLN